MNSITRRTSLLALAALASLGAPSPSRAQVQHDRGTILNMDWRAYQVEIEDAKDRKRVWKVAKDSTVKFSDEAWQNRDATIKDLRNGMYVHFTYSSGDPEIIQGFDVKDAKGYTGSGSGSETKPAPTPAGMKVGRVNAVDLNVAQVEVMLEPGGRKTFQAANAQVLAGIRPGDRIGLVTRSDGGQEIVTEVRRLRK
jgi:hypothetical protein